MNIRKMKSKVIMIIIAVIVLILLSYTVKATDNPITLNDLEVSENNTTNTETNTNEIIANQIVANQIAANSTVANSQVIQPTTNTKSNTVGNTLPKTGITEDITVMFFIVVCVISAIYAYKKIRDYNV